MFRQKQYAWYHSFFSSATVMWNAWVNFLKQELVPQEDIYNVLDNSTMECVSCVYTLQGYFPHVELTWLICSSLVTDFKRNHPLKDETRFAICVIWVDQKCRWTSCPGLCPVCGFFIDCLKTTDMPLSPLRSKKLSCLGTNYKTRCLGATYIPVNFSQYLS